MTTSAETRPIAVFVRNHNGNGDGRIYRLSPPLTTEEGVEAEFVWVSAVIVPFGGPETYVFPCTEDGEVTDWTEQEGSYRGGLDHETALRGAGYEVVIPS